MRRHDGEPRAPRLHQPAPRCRFVTSGSVLHCDLSTAEKCDAVLSATNTPRASTCPWCHSLDTIYQASTLCTGLNRPEGSSFTLSSKMPNRSVPPMEYYLDQIPPSSALARSTSPSFRIQTTHRSTTVIVRPRSLMERGSASSAQLTRLGN
jgi:hypothetical protein